VNVADEQGRSVMRLGTEPVARAIVGEADREASASYRIAIRGRVVT